MRPLGIPTMKDRAQQALYLLALAPVVETTADKNSYGFRQQRSCADAMEQCFKALRSANTQWILEGDIKSCFDKISHDWLLAHVPIDRVILQKWLKSGYMEKHVLHETTDGTPQGGIISPALANCGLDGLERLLREKYPAGKRLKSLGGSPCSPWINCRMLLALVSTIDSITTWPLVFRTAITIASLCTSMPIYLMSRLI